MGRFDERATQPRRGPQHIFKWKVMDRLLGKTKPDTSAFVPPQRDHDQKLIHDPVPTLTWIGHASFLLTLGGQNILIDPVFSESLGPGIKRYAPPGVPMVDLPKIDLVLITHNHRDHLDAWTLKRIGPTARYIVPVGNAERLKSLGIQDIVELDWWEQCEHQHLGITLVPARHWSMYYPWDRNDALWGGYVIEGPEGKVYHSGDTGFWENFAEIPERLGAIDWAMLPIGAYEPRWMMQPQHMGPEEAIEAAHLLQAKTMVAMHWGTFRLTDEPLAEPPERTKTYWEQRNSDSKQLWILDIGESRVLERG
jgi:N-acyl-phosphatidylethanolamine-hydrolysing phospholipase D